MHDRLAHIGVRIAGERAEPRLDSIERFANGREAAAVDDPLQRQQLFIGALGIDIADDEGRR